MDLRRLYSLFLLGSGGLCGSVYVTLYEAAVIIKGVDDLEGDLNFLLATGGNGKIGAANIGENNVRVVSGDLSVLINVGRIRVIRNIGSFYDVVKDHLRVKSADLVIAVEVPKEVSVCVPRENFAVDLIFYFDRDNHSVFKNESASIYVLSEEVCAEVIGNVLIGEVVDGELEGIGSVAVGIVAELDLNLAVGGGGGGVSVHLDIGTGGYGAVDSGKAGALLHDGVIVVFRVKERLSGGHKQALNEEALRLAGLGGEVVLTDVLSHESRKPGDLGSGHRGSAHDLVTLAARLGAVYGVDAAAGRGYLGLKGKVSGNAPAREVGHGVVAGIGDDGADAITNGDLAGIIGYLIGFITLTDGKSAGLAFFKKGGVSLGDGYRGDSILITRKIHMNDAVLVVRYDNGGCAVSCGGVGFNVEGDVTAVADGDLAGNESGRGSGGKFIFGSGAVYVDEVVLAGNRGNELVAVAVALIIRELGAACLERRPGLADVIDGGYGEGVGIGSGRSAGVEVTVTGIGNFVIGGIRPASAVAHGDGNGGIAGGEIVHYLLIGGGAARSKAGSAGAEGEVNGVGAENDGVLDGDHIVGIVGSAALAEDLHDEELGIGGYALGEDVFNGGHVFAAYLNVTVGGGDAGNVRAVLACGIVIVGNVEVGVDVVKSEGHLRVYVCLGSSAAAALSSVQTAPCR